jgi:hypothetical protein
VEVRLLGGGTNQAAAQHYACRSESVHGIADYYPQLRNDAVRCEK